MRRELVRNDAGQWLCNAVNGCAAVAVAQVEESCDECRSVAQSAAARADELHPQVEQILHDVTVLGQTLMAEERAPTADEVAQHISARVALEELAAQLRGHVRTVTLHAGPHTHPVMACKKHTSALDRVAK